MPAGVAADGNELLVPDGAGIAVFVGAAARAGVLVAPVAMGVLVAPVPAATTTIVPCMKGWMAQW